MSFILDALKKSDAERQKRSAPGFADIPESRARRQPQRWTWIVGGLLAVNFGALIVLLARPEPEPAAAHAPAPNATPEPSGTQAGPGRSFADIVAEARKNRPAGEPATESASPPQSRSETPPVADAAPQPAPVRAEASNTFESLRAEGKLQLPDLHLDIHVFSERAADRFVFVNMKKYKESETLAEGPVVREIAPEGVILAHAGEVFLLPRE